MNRRTFLGAITGAGVAAMVPAQLRQQPVTQILALLDFDDSRIVLLSDRRPRHLVTCGGAFVLARAAIDGRVYVYKSAFGCIGVSPGDLISLHVDAAAISICGNQRNITLSGMLESAA